MPRRANRTAYLSQQQTMHPLMLSASVNHTTDAPRTCGRCGLIHNSSGCCPTCGIQCGKCICSSHWEHMCCTMTLSRSLSRRGDNQSRDTHQCRSHHCWGRTKYQKGQRTPIILAKISNNSTKLMIQAICPQNYTHRLRTINCSEI